MSVTKAQIEKYFKMVLGTATCPFCHHQDFELVLDKEGNVALFGVAQTKGPDAPVDARRVPGADRLYIAARCKICNWVTYFDYDDIEKTLEASAK